MDSQFTEKLDEIPYQIGIRENKIFHSLEGVGCDWRSGKPNNPLALSMRDSFWFCKHCKY